MGARVFRRGSRPELDPGRWTLDGLPVRAPPIGLQVLRSTLLQLGSWVLRVLAAACAPSRAASPLPLIAVAACAAWARKPESDQKRRAFKSLQSQNVTRQSGQNVESTEKPTVLHRSRKAACHEAQSQRAKRP